MKRAALCSLPLALIALVSPALADDKQREIDELRARLDKAEDAMLEMARKFDQEKRRLLDEKEKLLKELAGKGGAAAPAAGEKTVEWGLKGAGKGGQTLGKLVALLKEHGLAVKLEGLTGEERLPIRLRGLTPRQLLDAAILNLKPVKGDKSRGFVEVEVKEQDGAITLVAAPKKPTKAKKKGEGEEMEKKSEEKDDD